MNSLRARQLLFSVASLYSKQREAFSKEEIVKKINEIKYLSSQKKVPKLSIRKEIVHLENKLQGVFDLERKLTIKQKKESSKISALKKQIKVLQEKLEMSSDPQMQKKIEKLSHVLGDYMAKEKTAQDVDLHKEMEKKPFAQRKNVVTSVPTVSSKSFTMQVHKQDTLSPATIKRIEELEDRFEGDKHELEIHKRLETKDPDKIELLEQKLDKVGDVLRGYYDKYPELVKRKTIGMEEPAKPEVVESPLEAADTGVKHTMLLQTPEVTPIIQEKNHADVPVLGENSATQPVIPAGVPTEADDDDDEITDLEIERELPLPPPPKLT